MRELSEFAKGLGLILFLLGVLFSARLRSCLLPFAAALVIAAVLRRPVARLESRLPRWLAAFVILSLSGLLALCSLTLLLVRLWQDLPRLLSGLEETDSLWAGLERLSLPLPAFLQGGAHWLLLQLKTQGSALTGQLTASLTRLAAEWAAALPETLFALGVTLLASFYAAADWLRVSGALRRLAPAAWQPVLQTALHRLTAGVRGWLVTQGRLMGINFLLLLTGLLLLRRPGAWVAALSVALTDALPVLGSGIILAPWAALAALQGEAGLALGLLALWATVSICRSVLEPRFLGRQADVSPLLTLLVIYAGFRLLGLPGLIAGPIVLSAVRAAA